MSDKKDDERLGELEKEIRSEIQKLKGEINKTLETSKSSMQKVLEEKQSSSIPLVSEEKASFLDYFGNFPTIEKLQINLEKSNLIKSIAPFLKDVNLQAIFLYVSILKILDIEISESFIEQAFKTMKKQTNEKIFTSPENQKPDPINIFYGLATILELIQYGDVDFIDLDKIKTYIQEELNYFDITELHRNYYLLNCYNILNRINQETTINKQEKIDELLALDLHRLPEHDPIRDTYEITACLRLLKPEGLLEETKQKYYQIIKNILSEKEISQLTVTESAQALLIIDLLDMKTKATTYIENLLEHINTATTFFSNDEKIEEFSWQEEKLALLVELRMLFYSLLVNIEYDFL